jgi:hypothetical protein
MVYRSAIILSEGMIAQDYPDLYDCLLPLLRHSASDLDAYLGAIACNTVIADTKTKAHCYFIDLDGNKRPRVNDFARFIGTKIVDFAIPRTEITRALNEAISTRSTAPIISLNTKARNLFTKLPKSGEGGEVLLSILAETILRLPQLFTKMVLKTNPEMHIHGSDGIHVGMNENNGNIAVYWGESKLYQDAASAVNKCFASLAPYLLDTGGSRSTQARDLQLMRDGLSLDDGHLLEALKRYLDPNNPLFKQVEYRGLCLVGFDSNLYPSTPNAKESEKLKEEIEIAFRNNISQIHSRVIKEHIESFVIEIFCLPFPSVDDFRGSFRKELGISSE